MISWHKLKGKKRERENKEILKGNIRRMSDSTASKQVCDLPYLKEDILVILSGFHTRTCEKEFIHAFSEDGCQGHVLVMEWFQKKGVAEFCRALPDIFDAIKKYWYDEFGTPLPETLLSPCELLQTYVYCKAKTLV